MTKPTEAPEVAEPEQQVPVPEASDKQPEETVTDTPPEILDLRVDDILIIGTGFTEPGNPTVLARYSAKQEVMERRKVRFDVSHYAQLSSSEVLSGYLNQVHSSRDLEVEMVKQMHQKYEVCHLAYISYVYPASPQVF